MSNETVKRRVEFATDLDRATMRIEEELRLKGLYSEIVKRHFHRAFEALREHGSTSFEEQYRSTGGRIFATGWVGNHRVVLEMSANDYDGHEDNRTLKVTWLAPCNSWPGIIEGGHLVMKMQRGAGEWVDGGSEVALAGFGYDDDHHGNLDKLRIFGEMFELIEWRH